jgi:hypothetical protein
MQIPATVGCGFQAHCGAQSPGLPAKVMPGKWVPRQPVFGKMRYKEVSACSLRTLAQLIPAA